MIILNIVNHVVTSGQRRLQRLLSPWLLVLVWRLDSIRPFQYALATKSFSSKQLPGQMRKHQVNLIKWPFLVTKLFLTSFIKVPYNQWIFPWSAKFPENYIFIPSACAAQSARQLKRFQLSTTPRVISEKSKLIELLTISEFHFCRAKIIFIIVDCLSRTSQVNKDAGLIK